MSDYQAFVPTRADTEELYGFIRRWDEAIAGFSEFTVGDLRSLTARSHFDVTRHWWGYRRDGEVVALGMTWSEDPGVRYSTFSVVLPAHRGRGLGTSLMQTTEERAAELAAASPHREILMRANIDRIDPGADEIVSRFGYRYVRSSYTMMAPLPLPGMDDESLPSGVTIRTAGPDEGPLLHELIEDTFAEHFGFASEPYEEWARAFFVKEETSPDLWFIAELDGAPAGLSVVSINGSLGWVDYLGVRKPARGLGIAAALLRKSYRAAAARGCTEAGLGVDASNETGAVALYEKVGLRQARVYDMYDKIYRA
jgi:ribosomal protein S18 acetylase RimI-like enzyme